MPPTLHGFCPTHRIAYNRQLDATCPQCLLAHQIAPPQLDYDLKQVQIVAGVASPIDPATGKALDPITLQPVA